MDIKESDKEILRNKHKEEFESIKKELTRNEFVKKVVSQGICPLYFGLDNTERCNTYKISCTKCWLNAVKDITFKGEEEIFKAECIDQGDCLYLTKGKNYQVIQNKEYDNYYDTVNDIGNQDSYKKKRFKIIEKVVESEKMEDKIIKVRCINNGNMEQLALKIGKVYDVIESDDITGAYQILIDDTGRKNMNFSKSWFEKVEDVLIVECVDNGISPKDLTLNKKYKVMVQNEECYLIRDDAGEWAQYSKSRFKLVEPQNEVKEMDFGKVIADIKPNEEYICQDNYIVRCHENGRIEFEAPSGNKIWFDKEDRFEKIEKPKPVTTAEAFKALDEGKIIESTITKDQYKKDVKLYIKLYTEQEKGFGRCINISSLELEGQWLIHE